MKRHIELLSSDSTLARSKLNYVRAYICQELTLLGIGAWCKLCTIKEFILLRSICKPTRNRHSSSPVFLAVGCWGVRSANNSSLGFFLGIDLGPLFDKETCVLHALLIGVRCDTFIAVCLFLFGRTCKLNQNSIFLAFSHLWHKCIEI